MKTLKVILVIMAFAQLSLAQVPKTFNYQAVARDENGLTLADQNIVVEISVRQASTSGTIAWQEVHYTQTNAFGLFTIEIGGSSGIQTEAGSASSFDAIDWSDNIYYIQTRVDFGKSEFINGFIDMGTVKLTSVPYAFIADSALNVAIPTLTEVLGMNQTALSINDVPKWDGSNWIVGSAGVAGNYITDDGTTDLIGDWTISSNSITLTSGNIGLTNGNLSLSNGILSTPALTMGGTTFTSVSSDLNSNSTASAIVTAEAVKTYVDNNIGVSYWSLNTGTIYNATNYIGIGTTLPTERLHVDLLDDETVLITGTFQLTGHVVNRGAGT
ncbi:MAG: hypothetical protein KAI79_05760, partial [Bacteroidales bacterium]|nr:hypothetical protein [Bacteroidales bacterium]